MKGVRYTNVAREVDLDGIIYYPHIRVPESAWFSRAILYWDSVATIVPDAYIDSPFELGQYTHDLVQRGLLVQLFPSYANLSRVGELFADYYLALDPSEQAHRRDAFVNGDVELIHSDKGTTEGFRRLRRLRICEIAGEWWTVERRSAADYMALLALALSAPGHNELPTSRDYTIPHVDGVRRVPVTDKMHSLIPLLSGTTEATGLELKERAEGQVAVGRVQMMVIEKLFPAPTVTVDPGNLERFRQRHGELLPRFRRNVEGRIDEIFNLEHDWQQRRALDRLESEFQEAIQEVEAYMSESRLGRILRSPWCALLGLIPALNAVTQGAAAGAEIALPEEHMARSPLAYAAFASAELTPNQTRPRVIQNEATALLILANRGSANER